MAKRKVPDYPPLQPLVPIRPPLRVLILYSFGQLGWSLGGYSVGNLLIYFYMPPEQGQPIFPSYLFQGSVLAVFTLVGILSSGGRFFDAIIDPIIANWSDRKTSRLGKRRWFMMWGAVPFAAAGFMVFFPITAGESATNFVWLALMITLYYFFFAFYVIPYTALMAELGHTAEDRLRISTLTSIAWALGYIMGNSVYAWQGVFENMGYSSVTSFQISVALLHIFAVIFMLIPAFFLNEKRYARQMESEHGIRTALKLVFGNHNFRWFLASDLMYWLALNFIQLGVVFYTTLLLNLDKSYAFQFSLVSFLSSFAFYWPINVLARKMGKKWLLLWSFVLFAIIFAAVSMSNVLPFPPKLLLYTLSVIAAFPLAVFGILPNAVIGDEVEKEERNSGQQLSGMFYGVRAFVMKVGISLSNLIFPSLLLFGKSSANPLGVQLTALAAILFCLIGWVVFRRYREVA